MLSQKYLVFYSRAVTSHITTAEDFYGEKSADGNSVLKHILLVSWYDVHGKWVTIWDWWRTSKQDERWYECLGSCAYFISRTAGSREVAIAVCVCVLIHEVMSNSCTPMDCGLPGSSVHRISQERILEWAAISSSRECSWPRDQTHTGRQLLHYCAT